MTRDGGPRQRLAVLTILCVPNGLPGILLQLERKGVIKEGSVRYSFVNLIVVGNNNHFQSSTFVPLFLETVSILCIDFRKTRKHFWIDRGENLSQNCPASSRKIQDGGTSTFPEQDLV